MVGRRAFPLILVRQVVRFPGRFIAIFLIVLLGVAFSVGVRATRPDMERTCDAYLDGTSCQDLWIVSGIGFTSAEIDRLRSLEGVEAVQGGFTLDALATMKGAPKAVKVLSIPDTSSESDINRPVLLSGRLPSGPGECAAEKGNALGAPAGIGDSVRFSTAQGNWNLRVVGIVESPLYISWERGTNSMGDGSTSCYFIVGEKVAGDMYTPRIHWPDGWSTDRFYPEVHVTLTGARRLDSFGGDYAALVKRAKAEIGRLERECTGGDGYWFVLDRQTNAGIRGFASDAQRIGNVGQVFPIIFFLVAALVSLTSMTRLIDEQRVQIGTLKALGYGKGAVVGQYVLYAASSTLAGGIVGAAIGSPILPKMIYSMYRLMYSVGALRTPLIIPMAAGEILAAVLCTTAATAIAGMADLLEKPAALMRPKAPRPGRRVILERLPWLWGRLGFLQKVTARNIFRYKKRLWMTLAGVAGCTALLLTGFGLYDSLNALTHRQFGEIYHYDFTCLLYDGVDGGRADQKLAAIGSRDGIESVALASSRGCTLASSRSDRGDVDATLIVPRDPSSLSRYVSLTADGRSLELPRRGAVLTRKAAELLHVGIGDTLAVTAGGGSADVAVSAITDQYVMHFLYMSPDAWQSAFGGSLKYNQVIGRTTEHSDAFESRLGSSIMADGDVRAVLFTSAANRIWDDTMRGMNSIVTIIVVSAGLLAFIVVYTLTSINITERSRELATIRVLGFRDSEVGQYVFRENAILTIIGIAVGLAFGVLLHRWVVMTAEVEVCMFGRTIQPLSFLWAALLTLAFALSVDIVMYPRLRRIDMVQAMKSVD